MSKWGTEACTQDCKIA